MPIRFSVNNAYNRPRRVPPAVPHRKHAFEHQARQKETHRQRQHHQHEQFPVQEAQDDPNAEDGQEVGHQKLRAHRQRRFQFPRVLRQPRNEGADFFAVKITHRKKLQMAKHIEAQAIHGQLMSKPRRDPALRDVDDERQQLASQHPGGDERQGHQPLVHSDSCMDRHQHAIHQRAW